MSKRINALARRIADDPFFLALSLHDYAQSEGLDDAGLAAALGCAVETLDPLRLCRRPRAQPDLFRQDVETISRRYGLRPDVLAEAVRRSEVVARLREAAQTGTQGLLMAARDRQEDAEEDGEHEGEPQ